MSEVLVVSTTVDSKEAADSLARASVYLRVAACAQVLGPIDSTYWWQDRIESAQEWLVLLKTGADRYPALEEHLRASHPYDVPEIVASPVTAGSAGYLAWVREQTRPS
ncbi:MAG TPA: divalent-cation tolerance protein CutA [Micromonosporaceae bacterium]